MQEFLSALRFHDLRFDLLRLAHRQLVSFCETVTFFALVRLLFGPAV